MKRKFLYLIAFLLVFSQANPCVLAKNAALSTPVRIAIKKYKIGNYTGCLQDCQAIIARYPSNSVAYYYMAMSYVQAGRKDQAISAYSKVLSLKTNSILREYATTGKRCLETPDQCQLQATPGGNTDLDKFIASPSSDGLSDQVRKDYDAKRLEGVKNEINNDRTPDGYEFKKFKDFSNQSSQAEPAGEKIAQKEPTNDEVIAALKVLKSAGINPYSQPQAQEITAANPYGQAAGIQNSEQIQLNALMGGNSQSGNNAMMNMLPFMLAQNKNGNSNYSPQLMQAVIMNSMMTDFNFDLDKDKNK
ncbi:MAG: tetratricopeptide repeat protein [Candidatus Gastranaerophilaceae bacterium]